MAVERLIQKIKLGEKRLIQDSMLKLISMISENKRTQEDIIKALPETELVKMMSYLEDSDPYFRKLTAKFFLDLVHGNFYVQQIFCEILGILPYDGKICINRVPDAFKIANKSFPECLSILKKVCLEETRETLPYCWYFSPENVDTAEKPIEFLSEDDRKGLENIDRLFDPLNAMFGFVLRLPKAKKSTEKTTEYVEKTITSKEYEAKRAVTAGNTKALNIANSSLEHSLHTRLLNDSKSLEREVVKNVSPARGFMTGGILSSRISYSRNSKPKVDVSSSICNSERFSQNKFALQSERNRDAPTKNMEREIHKIFGMKRLSMESDNIKALNSTAEAKDKKSPFRRPDTSVDNTELITSKLVSSNNESQELAVKFENSVCSSALNKSTLPIRPNEKSPDISLYKVANDKKSDNFKKSVDKYDKSYSLKAKQSESDKRSYKNSRDSTTYSSSATATPKNSLLSKILKDKPLAKEAISVSKYSKTKQDPSKRLNTTQAVSASQTTKHIAQKYSIGFQPPKNFGKPETDYSNKKYAFHSALLKSIDLHDQTNATVYIEEKEESAKENFCQDETDRRSSIQSKSKASQLSSVLKGTVVTPRTPTEILKSTISQNSKILNARRSYDTSSYLTSLARDKRKSEASIPLQSLKNRQNTGKDSNVRNSLSEFTLDFTQTITPKGYIAGK